MVPTIAVVLSAFLLWAAFPPLDIGPLALVAVAPFLWAVRQAERASFALFLGFAFGATFFGSLLFWIVQLGVVAWLPFTIFMGSITAAYGLLIWAFRLWPAWRWWLVAVGGWLVMEWLRGRFPFGGFPWGDIGYAASRVPGGLGSLQWIGPVGWTLFAVGISAGLALLIESKENWRLVVDTAVVALLVAIAGGIFPPVADGPVVQVAIVQGGTPCPQVHCQNENQRIFERHMALTQEIPADFVDLVVWPENSLGPPYEPVRNDAVRAQIIDQASRIGAYFLVSGTRGGDDPGTFINSNALYSPDGVRLGEYVKRHPVPFGEFVPMRGLLDFIPQLEQVPNDMVRGRDATVFPFEDGILGSVISFEGAFARRIRSMASAGASLLVVATNESSFGESPASDQLIGLVRANAAATGVEIAHAAITGRSAFIDAAGEVRQETELFQETVHYGRMQMRTAGPTLYTRFGDWVMLLALAGLIIALAAPGEASYEMVGRRREER